MISSGVFRLSRFWYDELVKARERARVDIVRYKTYKPDPTVLKIAEEMHNIANGIIRNAVVVTAPDPNEEYKLLHIVNGLNDIIGSANILKEPFMEVVYKQLLEQAKEFK